MTLLLLRDIISTDVRGTMRTYYLPCGVFESDKKLTEFIMITMTEFFYRHKRMYPDHEEKYPYTWITSNEHTSDSLGPGYYSNYKVIPVEDNKFYEFETLQDTYNKDMVNSTTYIDFKDPLFAEIDGYNNIVKIKKKSMEQEKNRQPTAEEIKKQIKSLEQQLDAAKLLLRKTRNG